MNRSALIRRAIEKYLQELYLPELEARDRAGYLKQPQQNAEYSIWEKAAAWPGD